MPGHCGPTLRYQLLLPACQPLSLSAAAVAFVLAIVSGSLVLVALLLLLPLLPLQHLNDSRWSCQSHG